MKSEFFTKDKAAFRQSLRIPLLASFLFHFFIFLFFSLSLPFLKKEPLDISTPVIVELVEIDDKTRKKNEDQKKLAKSSSSSKVKEEITQKDKPKSAPKVDVNSPPDLTQIKPQETKKDAKEAEQIPVPSKTKPKIAQKPPPKPKLPEKKEDQKKEKDFASLLKNLVPDAPEQVEEDIQNPSSIEKVSLGGSAERMTMSEQDALRAQLARCWNVLAGAKYAEDLVVEIRIVVNPDRTVQKATIVGEALYNNNTHFRAAADAALRALKNPRCTPLNLPPKKYNEWKVTTIRFDPREML